MPSAKLAPTVREFEEDLTQLESFEGLLANITAECDDVGILASSAGIMEVGHWSQAHPNRCLPSTRKNQDISRRQTRVAKRANLDVAAGFVMCLGAVECQPEFERAAI